MYSTLKIQLLSKIIETSIYQVVSAPGEEKFVKGSKSREGLIQGRQVRVDYAVRRAAEIKHDKRSLVLASRELVAVEAHWHRFCYKNYTRANSKAVNTTDTKELPDSYIEAELNAFSRLCDYIKNELFQNNDIIELVQLNLGYQMSSRQQTTHLRKKT